MPSDGALFWPGFLAIAMFGAFNHTHTRCVASVGSIHQGIDCSFLKGSLRASYLQSSLLVCGSLVLAVKLGTSPSFWPMTALGIKARGVARELLETNFALGFFFGPGDCVAAGELGVVLVPVRKPRLIRDGSIS